MVEFPEIGLFSVPSYIIANGFVVIEIVPFCHTLMHLVIICVNQRWPMARLSGWCCYCFPPDAINTNKNHLMDEKSCMSSVYLHPVINHEYEVREFDRKTIYVELLIFEGILHMTACPCVCVYVANRI